MLPVNISIICLRLEARKEILQTFQAQADYIPGPAKVIILNELIATDLLQRSCKILVVIQYLSLVGFKSIPYLIHLIFQFTAIRMLLAYSLLYLQRELFDSFINRDHFLLYSFIHSIFQLIHHCLRLNQHLLLHEFDTLRIVIKIIIVVFLVI